MLQLIRDRATGWAAWTIVILICIPFALWGVYDYMSPSQSVAIATVNGTEVDARRFGRLYQQQRYRLLALLGDGAQAGMIDDERLREQVLEQIVDDELLLQTARSDGLRIGDRRLAEAISSLPQVQDENGFSQELYDAYLRNQGLGPLGFEFEVRRNLLLEQVVAAVAHLVEPSGHELDEALRLTTQERVYSSLRLPAQVFRPEHIDESELRDYFESRRAHFSSPEQVSVEYIELSRDEIALGVSVDESELRSLYEERRADYTRPAQREASHILIALPADADEASEAEARARLQEVSRRLAEGMSFEEAAEQYSEDPGSARQGGALGWFSAGIMDPAFEEAAFALGEGEQSDVVRSAFGLHLIQVTGAREAGTADFEEVRERLRSDYQLEVAEQRFFEQVEQLANLAFEHPDTLAVAADALDVSPRRTGFIARSQGEGPGIEGESRFLEAAFSSEVIEEGNNSDLLEFEGSRVAVLRVEEHRPSRRLDFDEAREEVDTELRHARSAEDARALGLDIIARLRGGESVERVAQAEGFEWSPEGQARRGAAELSPELESLLFQMPEPAAGGTSYDGTAADNGDFVIVALRKVGQGDGQDSGAEAIARLRLKRALGQAELAATVASLHAGAEIVINEESLR